MKVWRRQDKQVFPNTDVDVVVDLDVVVDIQVGIQATISYSDVMENLPFRKYQSASKSTSKSMSKSTDF